MSNVSVFTAKFTTVMVRILFVNDPVDWVLVVELIPRRMLICFASRCPTSSFDLDFSKDEPKLIIAVYLGSANQLRQRFQENCFDS